MTLALLPEEKDALMSMSIDDLHDVVVNSRYDHGDLEMIIMARIAAIPRIPVTETRDGRWWPTTNSYPFGN